MYGLYDDVGSGGKYDGLWGRWHYDGWVLGFALHCFYCLGGEVSGKIYILNQVRMLLKF